MTMIERRLCLAGVVLFLFGLILGFAVPAFPDKPAVLNAHLTALGSGTFLIVIGLLWPKLNFSSRWSAIFSHLLWISFYLLEIGLTLAATSKAAADADSQSPVHMISDALNAVGAIAMAVAVVAVVVVLVQAKRTS